MKFDKRGALMEVEVPGMAKIQGKVRDIYDLGDKILIVVTDRLSAFDVIMDDGVPGKGKVLNSISTFWFRKFAGDWSWKKTLALALPVGAVGYALVSLGFWLRIPFDGTWPFVRPYAFAVDVEMS